MKIGILSDTHGTLHERFKIELKKCDYIIHAGDIGTEKCYKELKALEVPFYTIRGNCDKGSWAAYLPETLAFPIHGHIFYLIHNIRDLVPYAARECEYIISGHTHKYEVRERGGKIYLNPGSAGKNRSTSPCSILILTLKEDSYQVEKICL